LINNFPFLRDVPNEEVKKFQQISSNPNLTKGELEVERQQWAEKQNTDVMVRKIFKDFLNLGKCYGCS